MRAGRSRRGALGASRSARALRTPRRSLGRRVWALRARGPRGRGPRVIATLARGGPIDTPRRRLRVSRRGFGSPRRTLRARRGAPGARGLRVLGRAARRWSRSGHVAVYLRSPPFPREGRHRFEQRRSDTIRYRQRRDPDTGPSVLHSRHEHGTLISIRRRTS